MATKTQIGDGSFALVLSKDEAVRVITLLIGQLAECPVPHNQSGQCPSVSVCDTSTDTWSSLMFVVDPDKK